MNQGEGYITSEISQKEEKRKGKLRGSKRSWEFTSSDEESFPPGAQGRPILCSQLLFDHRLFLNKPSPHQSPNFGSTFYNFIVMGPLGLDLVRRQAQLENRDPTIGVVYGKGCLCDDECNNLLRQDQVPQKRLQWPVYCLLYHKGRTTRQFTAQQASGTICVALVPTRGQTSRIQWPALLRPD